MGQLGTCHISTQELTILPPRALQYVTKPFTNKYLPIEGTVVDCKIVVHSSKCLDIPIH
jgi:hypothetical protein